MQKYFFCWIFFINIISLSIYSFHELKFEKLTIMTRPLSQEPVAKPGGHASVMRSLIAGLEYLQVPYNLDPSIDEIGDVLHVTTQFSKDAVQQALAFKREGRVKKLLFGPNFFPSNANHPEVDIFLVPSGPMIKDCQKKSPSLTSHCRVWPSGVDPDYWQPNDEIMQKESKKVLLYLKKNKNLWKPVEQLVRKYGWEPVRLIYQVDNRCKYRLSDYRNNNLECRFAIFISSSETQGIALVEAWASNLPTFPWNPRNSVQGSCPYLNDQLGRDWKSLSELENLLQSMDELLPTFAPREWVLENMTDEVSVKILIGIINDLFL